MTPRELADHICATLRRNGHQAYLVGGCVRDLLLGREPADYDVSTDARPERVQQLFPHSLAVGAKFGVILVLEEGVAEEIAEPPPRSRSPRSAPTSAIPTGVIRTAWSIPILRKRTCAAGISRSTAC